MSKIRSKHTKPEIVVRSILSEIGIRYRLDSQLQGKPDIKIVGRKTVIFVDGCFWHGCRIHYVPPKSNRAFWNTKIEYNKARDKNTKQILRYRGYKVITVWEHEIKNMPRLYRKLLKLSTCH